MDRAFQRSHSLMLRGTFYSVPPMFSDTTDGKQIKIENSAFDTKELNIECQPRGGFVVWVKLRK